MLRTTSILLLFFLIFQLTGCTANSANINTAGQSPELPKLPNELEYTDNGLPIISVYIKSTGKTEKMDVETYLEGVLAGEMKNDWPIEALKAQAILARTYTLKFLETKDSRYPGADISTDVTEAQAYNSDSVNDRIKQAVAETKGIVMVCNGELPYAWFHAHSGGITELPTISLDFKEDPEYLTSEASPDSEQAPDNVKNWNADFSYADVIGACSACGLEIDTLKSFELGEQGDSGRSKTFIINGKEISAPSFRINIGADKLKSTLIESVTLDNETVSFVGRGYGHGVGMSQWGAYALAEKGATAQTIVSRYFKGVHFVDLWE